ncbi:MAG: hypothetical protein VCC36_11470 [Gammaproteobacteria bacterium]
MAIGADFDLEIAGQRRSGSELIPAAAGHFGIAVFWVNVCFHGGSSPIRRAREHTAGLTGTQGAAGLSLRIR